MFPSSILSKLGFYSSAFQPLPFGKLQSRASTNQTDGRSPGLFFPPLPSMLLLSDHLEHFMHSVHQGPPWLLWGRERPSPDTRYYFSGAIQSVWRLQKHMPLMDIRVERTTLCWEAGSGQGPSGGSLAEPSRQRSERGVWHFLEESGSGIGQQCVGWLCFSCPESHLFLSIDSWISLGLYHSFTLR